MSAHVCSTETKNESPKPQISGKRTLKNPAEALSIQDTRTELRLGIDGAASSAEGQRV